MVILTGKQIREADFYTIEHEPISSLDLMERASRRMAKWFCDNISSDSPLLFLVGKGNNGGDGLAVARLLHERGYHCTVYLPFQESELSSDCFQNYQRLPEYIYIFKSDLPVLHSKVVIVDALLGTGVRGEIKNPLRALIKAINGQANRVIALDLPSGMKTEYGNATQIMIKADTTLSLEFPKLAMLLPEAGENCGDLEIIPIGLSKKFIETAGSRFRFITSVIIKKLLKKRDKFAHKNVYGHTLLICGQKGMCGAALLSTGAALRSGCGLVTIHIPEGERMALQARYPSAMLSLDTNGYFSELPQHIEKYSTIGVGCGLGQNHNTVLALAQLLSSTQIPMVIDADALNIIAADRELQKLVPRNSILTPHLGELKRLVGEWSCEEDKISKARELSRNLQSVILVKGAYTMICLPDGTCWFNSTGNSGMAKGGSGDVLTGLLTGLLSRGYASHEAAILGAYWHGMAGDLAAKCLDAETINSTDLIDYLPLAMKVLRETVES